MKNGPACAVKQFKTTRAFNASFPRGAWLHAQGATIATNQVCYNLLTRAVEFEVIPFCAEHNIGVIA